MRTTRPDTARARSTQASTAAGRPAAISAWIAAAAEAWPRTALEVCRSRLPNWVWYSVRSHSPIRA